RHGAGPLRPALAARDLELPALGAGAATGSDPGLRPLRPADGARAIHLDLLRCNAMIDTIVQVILLLVLPPLMLGVIVKTKAAFGGRVGAPVLQPYYDLIKLFRKGSVLSRTTTWVFLAGPAVTTAAVLLAGLLVPMSG